MICSATMLLSLTLMHGTGVAAPAAAAKVETHGPAVEKLLTDPAGVPVELAATPRKVGLPPGTWPDANVTFYAVTASGQHTDGYAVIDDKTQQVVGFVGPEPKPPVPMDVVPKERAVEIAREFCSRHVPELSVAGGEVTVAADDVVTRHGAWMVRLRRSVQGVVVPTLADVGVRVYDAKVVWFRRKHVPVDAALKLPGEVTEERAKEIAAQNMPAERHEAIFWFDCVREIVVAENGQRNVWTLWAELRPIGVEKLFVQQFGHWQIDAQSGEVLVKQAMEQTEEASLRYRAAGGPRNTQWRPRPPQVCTDSRPVWSPDGLKLTFLSDRARPGYPGWLKRAGALFVLNVDGSGLKCLAAAGTSHPCWSPDGRRIAYVDGAVGRLRLLPVEGGKAAEVVPPEGYHYVRCLWLNASHMVVHKVKLDEDGQLVLLDLQNPAAQPKELTPKHDSRDHYSALILTADGKTLYYTKWHFESARDTWDLLRVDLTADKPEPQVVCDNPREGGAGQLLGGNRMFLWSSRSYTGQGEMWMVDLATGKAAQWRPPTPWMPGQEDRTRILPGDVCFSPDGKRLAFAAGIADPDAKKGSANLLWTCNLDGSNLKQVTPWENPVVALAPK